MLVRHNRLNSEKRLKLACTPLKSLQAKTVKIASNKFQAWWYVLCNVVDNSSGYNSMVFEPFLQFCFGPMGAEPNIRSEIVDTTAQVKRFPDVSLMAIATFVRILGESSAQINEIFKKYALDQIDRTICTERQFQNALARLIINACGEATFMLTNLGDDLNNNVDRTALVGQLWRNLLVHVNRVKSYEHYSLLLANVKQLLVTSSKAQHYDRRKKTIELVKIIMAMLMETVRTLDNFNATATDIESHWHDIVVGLMEIVTMIPAAHTNDLLMMALMIPPTTTALYIQSHTNILRTKFFTVSENREQSALNVPVDQIVHIKFQIWLKWFGVVRLWLRTNNAAVPKLKNLNALIDSIVECLLWPLTVQIDKKAVCFRIELDFCRKCSQNLFFTIYSRCSTRNRSTKWPI